jgi:cysteine sulfinate desulfinase/cysteine desulfurase-like protein
MRDPEPAGVVRFSLGPGTTPDQLDAVLELLPGCIAGIRAADALGF